MRTYHKGRAVCINTADLQVDFSSSSRTVTSLFSPPTLTTSSMLAFAAVLVLCFASVQSVGVCEGLFGVQWKMDPTDCSKFYWCMNGREYEFKCPENSVVNRESRSCVPKGSSYDTCKMLYFFFLLNSTKLDKLKLYY